MKYNNNPVESLGGGGMLQFYTTIFDWGGNSEENVYLVQEC